MCITTAECLDVIDRAGQSKSVNWVGLEYRYMPPIKTMLDRLADGIIGDVHMIAIREHHFPFLAKVGNWNRFRRNTGGTLVEKCCHFFDLMNLIAGSKPNRVMASGSQSVNHLDEEIDGALPDIIDNAFVIVEYGAGIRASLDLCMFAEGSRYQEELVVTGSEGKVEAFVPPGDSTLPGLVRVTMGHRGVIEEIELDDSNVPYTGHHHGSSHCEHLEFVSAIRDGAPPKVGFEDGLWSVAIGEAAHRSIDRARAVALTELIPTVP